MSEITVFCDASYSMALSKASLAIIIKCDKNKNLYISTEIVSANSSIEAEFKAISKAVIHINELKENNSALDGCKVKIYSDCKSVVRCINYKKHNKGIDKNIMEEFYNRLDMISPKKWMEFRWIRRKHNSEANSCSRQTFKLISLKTR